MSNYSSSSSSKVDYQTILAKANLKLISVTNTVPPTTTSAKSGVAYPFFIPDTTPDLNDKKMVEKLLLIRKTAVSGVNKGKAMPILVPVSALKIPGSTLSTWKLTLPNARHRPDVNMYEKLIGYGLHDYATPTTKLYRSNGTKTALFNRLASKLIVDSNNTQIEIENLVMFDRHKFETRFDSSSAVLGSLNMHAAAGLPYAFFHDNGKLPKITDVTLLPEQYYTTGDTKTTLLTTPIPIIEHAVHWARSMFNLIIEEASTFGEVKALSKSFFLQHPELNTFIVKRKDEKMEREEWDMKVRPYGTQPLPTRFVSMWAVKPLEDNLANFIEDANSISAYHYSPFYGGSSDLLLYFEGKYNKNVVFSGLAYGDDQLWQIKLKSGKVVFLAPDVSAMDMSTSNACVIDIINFVSKNKVKFPKINLFALYFSLSIAFQHDLHVGGPYIMSKIHSLLSGIPGTTIINILNSARIQTVVQDVFKSKSVTEESFFPILGEALSTVKSKLGYSFKGLETLSFDIAQRKQDMSTFVEFLKKHSEIIHYATIEEVKDGGIPLPFLSQQVQKYTLGSTTRILSLPFNKYKLGSTLVLPDSYDVKGQAKVHKTLERIAGAYITGGWADEEFSAFLSEQYKSIAKGLVNMSFSVSELPSCGENDILTLMTYLVRPELPSREFMFDFNTMRKSDFDNKYSTNPSLAYVDQISDYILPPVQPISVPNNHPKSEYILDKDDYSILDEIIKFDEDKIVDVKKMGHSNANTIREEKLKLARIQRLKDRRQAERFLLESVPSKSRKAGLRSMLDRLKQSDSRDDQILRMEEFYQDMDEFYDDNGMLPGEEYNSLKESNEAFYRSWDSYDEEGLIDMLPSDKNEIDEDEEYYSSNYGKAELEK